MSDTPLPPPPPPGSGYPPAAAGGSADVGSALSYGWAKFQANAGVLIAIIAIPFVIQVVLSIIGQTSGSVPASLLITVLGWIVGLVAQYGMYNSAVLLTRGETPTFQSAFQNDRWGEWVVFAIIYGFAVGVGLLLCGIGILLTVGLFGLAPYFFIDGRMGATQAIGASFNATKSNTSLMLALIVSAVVGF